MDTQISLWDRVLRAAQVNRLATFLGYCTLMSVLVACGGGGGIGLTDRVQTVSLVDLKLQKPAAAVLAFQPAAGASEPPESTLDQGVQPLVQNVTMVNALGKAVPGVSGVTNQSLSSVLNELKNFGSVTYSSTANSLPRLSVFQRLVNARVQIQPSDLPNKIVSFATNLKRGVTA
jgi:hypothetical protein